MDEAEKFGADNNLIDDKDMTVTQASDAVRLMHNEDIDIFYDADDHAVLVFMDGSALIILEHDGGVRYKFVTETELSDVFNKLIKSNKGFARTVKYVLDQHKRPDKLH